jgi:hypothetical protein
LQHARNTHADPYADSKSIAESISQRYADAKARAGTGPNRDRYALQTQIVRTAITKSRRN